MQRKGILNCLLVLSLILASTAQTGYGDYRKSYHETSSLMPKQPQVSNSMSMLQQMLSFMERMYQKASNFDIRLFTSSRTDKFTEAKISVQTPTNGASALPRKDYSHWNNRNHYNTNDKPTKTTTDSSVNRLQQVMNFKNTLGPRARIVRNSQGGIIGIELDEEAADRDRPFYSAPQYRMGEVARRGDQDVCCSTRESFFINDTLVDLFGKKHVISQYNQVGAYQFIRHGFCGKTGLCHGQCVQSYVTMCLAIVPPPAESSSSSSSGEVDSSSSSSVTFKFFNIPGYCSCKVIGG